jgi:ankyrin repeat protein
MDIFGRTPLHYLARHGNALGASVLARALPALLRQDLKDDAGYTAVDAAAHMGWSKVVDTLVELGAGTVHTAHTARTARTARTALISHRHDRNIC